MRDYTEHKKVQHQAWIPWQTPLCVQEKSSYNGQIPVSDHISFGITLPPEPQYVQQTNNQGVQTARGA